MADAFGANPQEAKRRRVLEAVSAMANNDTTAQLPTLCLMGATGHTTAELPTLCLMGATGVGKGSTLNSCFRSDRYSVGHLFASDTVRPMSAVLPWRGGGSPVRGVDLCGFSDSEGRDTGFIESMVSYLRNEVGYVNCFLLLFNAQETRIGVHLKDMLNSLKAVFGTSFMKNVLIGFTRWEYTKRAAILQKRRGITKDALTSNMNAVLRDIVGHDHDCPCVFLDNTLSMCADEELEELYGDEHEAVAGEFEKELETIREFAASRAAFRCGSIEGTLAERDVGRDRIEREQASRAEGAASLEALQSSWRELGIEEPEALSARLKCDVLRQRDALAQFLAVRTKADLGHVKAAVLAQFDGQVSEEMRSVEWKNGEAARHHNRELRQELVEQFGAFAAQRTGDLSSGKEARFQDICARDRESVLRYVAECKGGSLAWQPFAILQDNLRWESLVARDELFGEAANGGALPTIRAHLGSPGDLVSFLGGEPPAPDWLRRLTGCPAA